MALPKLFQRIIFHNNTTPAINEDNLNAISKAIDDIDDRIIELAADILEKVPIILDKYEDIEELTENPPYIGANGNWYVWDASATPPGYVDSGVDASITVNIADITMLAPDATPYVTNTGTNTDPIFHLFLPRGVKGDNGVSPGITITTITGGHRVTITDADHPTGQSFDVMDGTSTGDMQKSVYDANNTVANAGGIADYVSGQTSGKLDKYSSSSSDWDTAPTNSSNKAITSGGVYTNTVRGVQAATSSTDGQVGVTTTKGTSSTSTYAKVCGWDKLVGKWTTPVSVTSTATSVNLTNPYNSASVDVDPYCERSSGKPVTIKTQSVTASTITLTFDALGEAGSFKAKVTLNS